MDDPFPPTCHSCWISPLRFLRGVDMITLLRGNSLICKSVVNPVGVHSTTPG